MRSLTILLATTAMTALIASAALAETEDRACLDRLCHMQSLHNLEGLGLEGLGLNFLALNAEGSDKGSTVAQTFGTWGFDVAGMDPSVKPGDDFNAYAGGKAIADMVIPSDRTSYGSFLALRNLSENRLKALIDKLATAESLTGDDKKVADLYKAMMNQTLKNALDIAPIYPTLITIRNLKTKRDMAGFMGQAQGDFGSSIFGAGIGDDAKNPQLNTLYMSTGGLSLPDRDYYLKPEFADKKAKYEIYVADMLRMAGFTDATKAAKDIVTFETQIAEVSWSRIESRNRDKTYNPATPSELKTMAPEFAWDAYLSGADLSAAKVVVLRQNTAFPKIAKIYAATPIETLKAWQTFKVLNETAPYLSSRFSRRAWEFNSRDLSGALSERDLWKRAISVTEGQLGEALGRAYVADYFPAQSKTKMEALVADLRSALKIRINNLDWMSPPTKVKAQDKLSKFNVKIGYPDTWKDYSRLEIVPDDLIGNVRRGSAFSWAEDVEKLGKPVDKAEWGMTPQTVNAYYNSVKNEIVFPAAILQPPFFDPDADPAVNYGGIGGVIGHEIIHGFDDQGRKSDGDGTLRDWWTTDDAARFEVQAAKLGAQYDAYEPIAGARVQGKLTMGENIADLGGVLLGLDAYRLSLKGTPSPVLDGLSGDQRVFLGFAQIWRSKYRDEALKQQVVSDPHAPSKFRTIGPVRNVDDWYKAFNVNDGKYYLKPEDRVRLW